MSRTTRVQRNVVTIDGRHYEARVLGGGKFDVTNVGVRVGSFSVKAGVLEIEDLGKEGVDSIEEIALLWVGANLSTKVEVKRERKPLEVPPPPEPAPPPPAPKPEPKPAPKPAPDAAPAGDPTTDSKGDGKPTRQVLRIATHNKPDGLALKKAYAYQTWLKTQKGLCAAYLTHEPETGRTLSISVWASKDDLLALRYAKPPQDATALPSTNVELLWVID